jgi:hypothetical protein
MEGGCHHDHVNERQLFFLHDLLLWPLNSPLNSNSFNTKSSAPMPKTAVALADSSSLDNSQLVDPPDSLR